jgi:hypothetical protein
MRGGQTLISCSLEQVRCDTSSAREQSQHLSKWTLGLIAITLALDVDVEQVQPLEAVTDSYITDRELWALCTQVAEVLEGISDARPVWYAKSFMKDGFTC